MTTKQKQQLPSLTQQQVDELLHSFEKFVVYYVKLLGFKKLGLIQREMIAHMVAGHHGVRIHVFRGSSKSFLLDLLIIWRILRAPDTKILIFSAKEANAARHIREVKKLLGLSPLTANWLNLLRTENKTMLDFTFSTQEAAPSIMCVGIDAAVEGARADLCLLDDIENAVNSRTANARAWLIQRMNECQNIVHPVPRFTDEEAEKTAIVVVGTFFSQFTVYKPPSDGSGHPLKGFAVYHKAALDEKDESTFPERFPTEVLHRKRATIDEREWVLQYLLDLTMIGSLSGVLDWGKIVRKKVDPKLLHHVTLTLDPVTERIKGKRHLLETDEIAYTIAGLIRGPTGKLNRLHIIKIAGSSKHATEEYIRHVVIPDLIKYKVFQVQVEANMAAAYNVMRRLLVEQKIASCGLMAPYQAKGNKHDRILCLLEPNLNSGLVTFEPSVLDDENTAYQLKDITYLALPGHDDRIDSLAQMIEVFQDHLAVPDTQQYDTSNVYIREG